MNAVFLFPGQGSQSLNMMSGFNHSDVIRQTFAEASEVLNQDLWALMNGEDNTQLNETVNTQPLMLTAGIATWRVCEQMNVPLPIALAGHSLGEYTALVAAGSLDFADAVKLVRLRAELMQQAVPQGEGGMAAVLGLSDDQVKQVCQETEQALSDRVVEAVNFNAPGQVVIAGHADAIKYACELAKTKGAKRALPLSVSVPSHCRLMKPAAEKLAQKLAEITFNPPKIRVVHNCDLQSHYEAEAIRRALVQQLYLPVRWTETIAGFIAEGLTQFAECGPGKVLTGLTKRIDKSAQCNALISEETIHNWINEH